MGKDGGGDIYGDGDRGRHSNYTNSDIDGNAEGDSNGNDIDFDSDINTDNGGDSEGDDNVQRDDVEVKTKGRGAGGRRLKSLKEQAIEKSNKLLRLCRKCDQKTTLDSRNCDKIKGVVNL
ncbi:hypothetical protein CASFOL_000801 [Castilleja foliolosa]|uniref:Uncharacterized protein n=1 Tax=Castilleja foliolosa TaxID=1961234 RepID=A0ABD3EPI7_9LAMI